MCKYSHGQIFVHHIERKHYMNIFHRLRKRILEWIFNPKNVTIGEIYHRGNMSSISVPDVTGAEKFIGESSISTLIVETDIGYSLASKCLKTVPYETHELFLSNGMSLRAADRHIVIDSTGAERYIKDLTPNDFIATRCGPKRVARVVKREHSVNMYDLSLDDDRHLYYTNGILSHNSTIIAMYLLWFGMFNFDKTILVASNKNTNAMEIMARIKYAYEELPMWLKPGVNYYTKHSMEFDNGSKIISQATTANTGRGMSCVSSDTLITVRNKKTGVQETLTFGDLTARLGGIDAGEKYMDDEYVEIKLV
jgi:hypothetical protein